MIQKNLAAAGCPHYGGLYFCARCGLLKTMTQPPETSFAKVLAMARLTQDYGDLAEAFFDQSVNFRLEGVGSSAPAGIGAHIRRSFLGALGPGASDAARAGKPCNWDPPSALDVFCREQLRGPKGDGLPKPYVIEVQADRGDLLVTLRVFGMANDWFMVATEAMAEGFRTILPWERLYPGRKAAPAILARDISIGNLRPIPTDVHTVRLVFTAPTDIAGKDPRPAPHLILTRLQRRVDAISRWNGLGLSDDAGRMLASQLRQFSFDASALVVGNHLSPNACGEVRRKETMTGILAVTGNIPLIWPLLAMGEKCHLGRGAVEGLGTFRLEV